MEQGNGRTVLTGITIGLAAVIVFGLFWFFLLGPTAPVGIGWYLFSFTSGLTMIVLACTFPLVFVIVPLSLGKGPLKGVLIALAFSLGVVVTLSLYGVAAALLGNIALGTLGGSLETVKNWLYLIAGFFAYLFALGEIGLLKARMPSYTGAVPGAIQKQQDYVKAFLLGLFLGNIGVGCPHPATPVILTRIAVSGSVFYGWLLFLIHAVGRVLPLLVIAFLGILGVNALNWLVSRKEKIEKVTGWGMVMVAAFILVLGLFTHDWWVYSGQHSLLEKLTQEEFVLNLIGAKLGAEPAHAHALPAGKGLFGLPLEWGTWVLVALWLAPLWFFYHQQRQKGLATKIFFWFCLTFSLLIMIVFLYVIPDWFLFHRGERLGAPAVGDHLETMIQDEGAAADLRSDLTFAPLPAAAGTPVLLQFALTESVTGRPIVDLEVEHEKLMHVIGVREDLNEFFHIHPNPVLFDQERNILVAEHIFEKPGIYQLWSEVKRRGRQQIFVQDKIIVVGTGATDEKAVSFGRSAIIDRYQVVLEAEETIVEGQPAVLHFELKTIAGNDFLLESYLGEQMHLAVIKDDLKQFVHTHPDNHNEEHSVNNQLPEIPFTVIFPESGLYKLFAQFRPQGIGLASDRSLTVGFWVRVVEKPVFGFALGRGAAVGFSLLAIVVLSVLVRRFIKGGEEKYE